MNSENHISEFFRSEKPSGRSALIECIRIFGSEVELNRLGIHPLLRRSRGSGAPPARIGWKRLLQGLVQSQFQWSVNRAFLLEHHNAILK